MHKILFATHNKNKVKEVETLLGNTFDITTPDKLGEMDEIEETGNTLKENAFLKTIAYKKYFEDYFVFAEDTGLEVDALNGAPGVYSARFAGLPPDNEANMKKLLLAMRRIKERNAQFKTIIALHHKSSILYFEGICKGTIAYKAVGHQGFGYDPIFIPEGYSATFGQLDKSVKNKLSHRAKAINLLTEYLKINA